MLALKRLRLTAADAVALEDSPPGIAAAKAAGLSCVAVLGTAPRERLGQADEIVPSLDAAVVDRLLGRSRQA